MPSGALPDLSRLDGASPARTAPHLDVVHVDAGAAGPGAARVFAAIVAEQPNYILTAAHTREGLAEWFSRKPLERVWFALDHAARPVGVVASARRGAFLDDGTRVGAGVELCRLAVMPAYRRFGVGAQLCQAMLADVRHAGDEAVWLSVVAESPAARWYARAGWQLLGTAAEQDDPSEHLVTMSYALTGP